MPLTAATVKADAAVTLSSEAEELIEAALGELVELREKTGAAPATA